MGAPRTDADLVSRAQAGQLDAFEELVRRQLTLGEDISLVSCDSVALTELFQPPIAVVRRDERALGSRAAELLLRLLADENPDGPLTMPTAFVPRPSCGPPS